MVSFEFATATRILFGPGRLADLPAEVAALAPHRVLLVTGRSTTRANPVRAGLAERSIETVPFAVPGEPTVDDVREAASLAVTSGCQAVVAIGGGSALDCGKAIAALAVNGGDPLDYLEVVGRGLPLTKPSLPFIAVPTTAGTGSEVTRNAVLTVSDAKSKVSLRSPSMLARLAIVDPDLLVGISSPVLASSGIDALVQLVEPYLSSRANPLTDALVAEGVRRSARSLRKAFLDGPDAPARVDLAVASLFGGICLANAGLGAVHGMAAPIGGGFRVPHGAACAALFVATLRVNLSALRARAPFHASAERYRNLAQWVTGRVDASAEDGIAWVAELCHTLRIPGLATYGMTASDIPWVVERARAASSMRANPIALTEGELFEIAERSLHPV